RPRSAVAQWKRQLTWFAATLTGLVVLVAGISAAALWLVITEVESVQAADEARSRAAVDTRLAVVEVESLLARTIAEEDPAKVRAAAVASIAAASRLEDAVTALRSALPGNANAEEMGRLVDSVKEPRVQVIVLARKGARAEATAAREAIAEPLRRIDTVSSKLLEEQAATRQRAGQQRATLFQQMLIALLAMAVVSTAGGLLFYRHLKRRFAPVEQLLEEVAHSAGELAAGGQELDGLNGEVQQSNRTLRVLLERFQDAAQSMTQEADGCLQGVEQLDRTCRESASMSRRHAEEAAGVATQIHATTTRLHALLETTHALSRSRSDITRFADQIETISFTTRILSLNAAVEAARAGAAGRGFSVIASSVRRLSEDTQEAALQIRRASEDITRGLDATATAVEETSALMDAGAVRIAALDSSARSNQALAEGMHHEVQGFRGTFQRQVEQVRSMDHASQAVAEGLADGDRHAHLLDATSSSLTGTSSSLLQRLSNLQA
ncbi:MAG: chemotaxis protein, partial [Ramlibacter sp.]|nr:chemotaxis protein [Ramlibacter sp.]